MKLGISSSVILTISIAGVLLLSSSSGIFNEKAYAGNNLITQFGDFKCWGTVSTVRVLDSSLTLIDQFGTLEGDFDLTPREYCTAADKGITSPVDQSTVYFDSPFLDLAQHYQGWLIDNVAELGPDPGTGTRINVQVDQFGHNFDTTLGAPYEILVPASKVIPGIALPIDSWDTDTHWKCYMTSNNVPTVTGSPVSLTTQHGTELLDVISDPFLFCTPVVKITPTGQFGNNQQAEHLVCYNMADIIPQQPTQPLPTILIDQITQFQGNDIQTTVPEKFCAPAFKSCPAGTGGVLPDCRALVAGSMTPIDTTMVLVAGTHSVAAWMIPVIVSGIGFAIVIARKF